MDRARAELKSRFLCGFAAGVIRAEFPELATRMHVRTAVLDWATRSLQQLPAQEPEVGVGPGIAAITRAARTSRTGRAACRRGRSGP